MAKLKNYRVKSGSLELTVQLDEDTKDRLYPDAVEVTTADAPAKEAEPETDEPKDTEETEDTGEAEQSEATKEAEPKSTASKTAKKSS